MYSMFICLLPMCLFIVMSYVTLLSMEEIKNTYLLTYLDIATAIAFCLFIQLAVNTENNLLVFCLFIQLEVNTENNLLVYKYYGNNTHLNKCSFKVYKYIISVLKIKYETSDSNEEMETQDFLCPASPLEYYRASGRH